jgi:hypothetical protein
MTILQLTPDDVEGIHYQILSGKSRIDVANDLGISVEMVVCAERQWANSPQTTYSRFVIGYL